MNQQVITTTPAPNRHRTTFIAVGLCAVLTLGAGAGVAALTTGGTETTVRRSTPTPRSTQATMDQATQAVTGAAGPIAGAAYAAGHAGQGGFGGLAAGTAPASTIANLCGNDVTNLLTAIAALPPSVQAQVVGSLSPDLADWLGHLALYVDPNELPPAPDPTTLGQILTRLVRADRNTIMDALPVEQQPTVTAAEQSAAMANFVSGTRTCS
jgi:hypothetical protein